MGVRRHLLDTVSGVAVTTAAATPVEYSGNRTGDAELTQANFDINMVIILAALLCALICALGLNSIVRCVLRCSRRLEVDSAVARTGMKKSSLRKIPIFVYGLDRDTWIAGMNPGSECPICLGEFVDGEKVRVLPECNHGFHVGCIDTWLGSHSSCPNCRHSLLDTVSSKKAATPRSDDGGGGVAPPPQLSREGGRDGGGLVHVVVEENAGS